MMFLESYTIVNPQIRIHQTSAPPCRAAPYCACAEPPRRHRCTCTAPHRYTSTAHVLTNVLTNMLTNSSLLNSDK